MTGALPAQLWHPRYWPSWLGVGLLRLAGFLPHRLAMGLGRGLGALAYRFWSERRRIARINLGICFPKLSESERESLLRRHFASLGMGLTEVPLAWWASARQLAGLTRISGLEHLQAAREQGRGVILLAAHFTSLEMTARLLFAHVAFLPVYRPHDDPVQERVIEGIRVQWLGQAISRDRPKDMIKALKSGAILWYAPDQNSSRKSAVFAPFCGETAATSFGTSRLAAISGAVVVPFKAVRGADARGYELRLEPALDAFPSGDQQADATRINALIETWVRETPEQYLWIHRRFRTRPNRADPSPYDAGWQGHE